MVVAWSPPLNITDMKIVKGYSIYVNGIFKQTVLGALRTKALVSNVDSKVSKFPFYYFFIILFLPVSLA